MSLLVCIKDQFQSSSIYHCDGSTLAGVQGGCPWELLYADDLVIIAETLEELEQKLRNRKKGLEEKGLKVNVPKTKVIHSRHDAPKTKVQSVKFPCGVCYKGVGANSILWHNSGCT